MPTPGMVLAGKYRLEAEIGRGGMGSVWRAKRLDLDADVAVKVLHVEGSPRADLLGRFSREAKATARLSSPHVIRIIDFGVDSPSEHAFLVMELLLGETLRQRLNRARPLPPQLVARVLTQVGRALEQAHSLGIVHRDLSPGNIFLVQNGEEELVKLLDFGIAKTEEAPDEVLLTQTGNVLGTPQYMSPEQLSSSKAVDHRSDLWSLAVIAYECLVGSRPFRGATIAELAMKVSLARCEPPSHVAPVPAGLDEWFARATEVAPERRFQSASELTLALQRLTAEGLQKQQPATTPVALPASPVIASPVASVARVIDLTLADTVGDSVDVAEAEAASVTSNTNSAVIRPIVARVAAARWQWSWLRWGAVAAMAAGAAFAVVGLVRRPAPPVATRSPSVAGPVEVSSALRQEPGTGAAPARLGAVPPRAALLAPPAASSDLSAVPPVPSMQGAASAAVGPVSEAASPAVRAAARGREAAARRRSKTSELGSTDAVASRKRQASSRKPAPPAAKAGAASAPNPLDAYDRP